MATLKTDVTVVPPGEGSLQMVVISSHAEDIALVARMTRDNGGEGELLLEVTFPYLEGNATDTFLKVLGTALLSISPEDVDASVRPAEPETD